MCVCSAILIVCLTPENISRKHSTEHVNKLQLLAYFVLLKGFLADVSSLGQHGNIDSDSQNLVRVSQKKLAQSTQSPEYSIMENVRTLGPISLILVRFPNAWYILPMLPIVGQSSMRTPYSACLVTSFDEWGSGFVG